MTQFKVINLRPVQCAESESKSTFKLVQFVRLQHCDNAQTAADITLICIIPLCFFKYTTLIY